MAVQTKMSKNRAIESNNKEERKKWVINLFDTPLTEDQEKLLVHGPKFVITPKETLVDEYRTAVEQGCTKLEQGKQEELIGFSITGYLIFGERQAFAHCCELHQV